jgi:GDP-4-dehydro-6-deoxy-D-mannose reductase
MESGQPGRAYNVCSGRAFRIGDLLERLQSMARVPIAVETDPDRMRPNDVPTIQGDGSRIRTELGWAPTFSIEQTLRDTLDWWRAEIHAGR